MKVAEALKILGEAPKNKQKISTFNFDPTGRLVL